MNKTAVVREEQRERAGLPIHDVHWIRPVRCGHFHTQIICRHRVEQGVALAAAREGGVDPSLDRKGGKRKVEISASWTRSNQHLDGFLSNTFELLNVYATYH